MVAVPVVVTACAITWPAPPSPPWIGVPPTPTEPIPVPPLPPIPVTVTVTLPFPLPPTEVVPLACVTVPVPPSAPFPCPSSPPLPNPEFPPTLPSAVTNTATFLAAVFAEAEARALPPTVPAGGLWPLPFPAPLPPCPPVALLLRVTSAL